jgi:hypothetical protein
MATTTPNFGWAVPTSTDLVKDGAVAIETLGDSIDASLVDLKGGTTGQVLAKASGTDMDFTWVAQDDSNAIQNAIVDAKGDLIAATAADTPARLAVGTNGQVLTADSTAATGLAWATAAGSSGPAFRAFRSGTDQTVTGSTTTKIQFNSETFDTDSCYDPTTNYRFTPNKAGYYQVTIQIYYNGAGNFGELSIYKNGAQASVQRTGQQEGLGVVGVVDLISMNGTTDYLEGYTFIQDSGASEYLLAYSTTTFFNAVWIRSN